MRVMVFIYGNQDSEAGKMPSQQLVSDMNNFNEELVKAGFKSTIIGSTGGFLREGNTTYFVGLEDEHVPALREILDQNCHTREQVVNVMPFEASQPGTFIPAPVKVPVGGAVLFVLDVDQFHRF